MAALRWSAAAMAAFAACLPGCVDNESRIRGLEARLMEEPKTRLPPGRNTELYSWQRLGQPEWHFAMLPATVKPKSRAEILGAAKILPGLEALKAEILAMPAGGNVLWLDGPMDGGGELVFLLPPSETIDEVWSVCNQRKMKLYVEGRSPGPSPSPRP